MRKEYTTIKKKMYLRKYGGLIWTNHAIERLKERGLSQEDAWYAYRHPDSTSKDSKNNSMKYEKKVHDSTIGIVIKENEKKELIVLSCWIEPPVSGSRAAREKEEYKKYKKASHVGKILYLIKKQLGY